MDWKTCCVDAVRRGKILEPPAFYAPATPAQLNEVEQTLGAKLPGDLAALLRQTNGLRTGDAPRGAFLVLDCEHILKAHAAHLEFLQLAGFAHTPPYLFFSDNGCGEHFGYEIEKGAVPHSRIGVYYPIENAFRIVAGDLEEWLSRWAAGALNT